MNPVILIGIPLRDGLIRIETMLSHIVNRGAMHIGMPVSYAYTIGVPYPECHEKLADIAVEKGCKYLLLFEEDMILPPQALYKLLKADKDVITAIYYDRHMEDGQPLICKEIGKQWKAEEEKDEVFPIQHGGIGCVLIKTEALKKLPKPWFDIGIEENVIACTSDITFYMKCLKVGIQPYAHRDVVCGHIDMGTGKISPSGWQLRF